MNYNQITIQRGMEKNMTKFNVRVFNSQDDFLNFSSKEFDSIESAREFIKSIYEFKNMEREFYKNYTFAALYQVEDKHLHIEDYVGRGTEDQKNKIQVWARDRYDMWKNDFNWRVKEIIEVNFNS